MSCASAFITAIARLDVQRGFKITLAVSPAIPGLNMPLDNESRLYLGYNTP